MAHRRNEASTEPDNNLINLNEQLRLAINLLYRACRYTRYFRAGAWDFAVEIAELRRFGLTNNEFRWLLASNYVEHAEEITQPGDEKRTFRAAGKHDFSDRSCFVLTSTGADLAAGFNGATDQEISSDEHSGSTNSNGSAPARLQTDVPKNGQPKEDSSGLTPRWDAERKELRLGKHLVKVFKWPSPNQETILAVFEEEGWPAKIDDPLPIAPEQDPKRRLHDTIKCLNRNHKLDLIRFRGDGTGEGVIWTHLVDSDGAEEDL